MSGSVAGPPHPGGITRILIIDDDDKSVLPPRDGDTMDGQDTEAANGSRALAPEFEGRPVVHELQVPGPTGGADLDGAHPDTSVVRELIARVEELLHRTRGLPAGASSGWAGTIRFGSVLLEPATQTVLRGGQPVRVTHTEFRLLLALMRRRGAIASRMELLREVWGASAAVSRRAVDTHIARLRRKLEEDPANPRHILTALAWGYRFRP
ncbi:MAG TPA: response regulator transcription factor [Gemmatimonadales bacterium]|nr:response regulator transcription factor [Gemmatimonadales bacterium]